MYRNNHTKESQSLIRTLSMALVALFVSSFAATSAIAQQGLMRQGHDDDGQYENLNRGGFIEYDPTLDVEVWTDNESGEFYEGDEIHIYFRTNRDAYVAVYNIDTEGRVNLIYPFDQNDDPFIEGGRIYRIPGPDADYDLLIDGPAGSENIQIIASRRPFPIPNWYAGTGLVADRDRYDFMDYINNMYFGCRSGCPRALDNVSYVVKEWDDYYYRPVYSNPWPVWGSYGGLYVDYYWGSSIYVDGYYYGISPLYLPRIGYGNHVVTVYDSYGYGWENSVHINNSSAIHLDNSIIRTTAGTHSRYSSVRKTGYRNPTKHGYADVKITSKYRPESIVRKTSKTRTVVSKNGTTTRGRTDKVVSRGFNYKKNDRAATSRKTTTRTKVTKSTTTKSSKSSKRLKAYKSAPDDGSRARVGKSTKSRSSSKNSANRTKKSTRRSESSRATSSRSSTRSSSSGKVSGRTNGKSTYKRSGKKSTSSSSSKAKRSKSSSKSRGKSKASRSKTRSGSSKSSSGARRSSGRSGSSSRATSRSSGSRSGRSGGSSRGGRSGKSGGSRGKKK